MGGGGGGNKTMDLKDALCEDVTCIHLARDSWPKQSQVLVNTVMLECTNFPEF
jgi:hypothetical protein